MLIGLYIFHEDEFKDPLYSDPEPDDLDDGLWEAACTVVHDAIEEEGDARGELNVGEYILGWRSFVKQGLSFVAIVTDDVKSQHVETYLREVSRRYFDEVDEPLAPDRAGVEDVVVDVIPPWEDDED
jgi:hypothetical protein